MSDESCPQCLNSMTGYASRLVQDSCGHKKCRKCLLADENGCKTCEQLSDNTETQSKTISILEKHLLLNNKDIKNNVNVIKFYQNDSFNYQHVSVLKTSNCLNNFSKQKDNVKKESLKCKTVKNTTNNETKQLKCIECGQGFRRRSHLEWHMRRHTGERPFACDKCTKTFTQKSKLNVHRKLHSDERPHECNHCDKAFQTKGGLLSHLRTHTGEKPYDCKQCLAKFSELSNLNKHLTIHTKEKPFMCADCGARFSLKWRLTVHLRVHSRERPFACNQCQRAFNNQKDLNRHKLIHSNLKPFSCIKCNTLFGRKDNLERHIKNTHPDIKSRKTDIKLEVNDEPNKSEIQQETVTNSTVITEVQNSVIRMSTTTKNITEKSNTVSVINGPVKLACKTKDFKDNYNIVRAEPEILNEPNVDIYKCILSPLVSDQRQSSKPMPETLIKTPPNSDVVKCKPITVPRIHYETSFESGQHAIIKNIKFKLPPDYTPALSQFNSSETRRNILEKTTYTDEVTGKQYAPLVPVILPPTSINNNTVSDKINCVKTITKLPAQDSIQHWRKRTSQIYNPD